MQLSNRGHALHFIFFEIGEQISALPVELVRVVSCTQYFQFSINLSFHILHFFIKQTR